MTNGMIYMVMGNTGEYSDAKEWPVVWCETKDEAETARAAYDAAYRRVFGYPSEGEVNWPGPNDEDDHCDALMLTVDPGFSESYTGTAYEIVEVPKCLSLDAINALGPPDSQSGDAR